MPVTADKPAPYAPVKTITEIIERHRERGLPNPVNAENLARIGVPESLVARTIQALQSLDLVTEAGMPTATLEAIRVAPQAEYKKRLEDWLKSAYADIFSVVDPAKDGDVRIRDAFRNYQPTGQQGRMVILFEGLCAAAGIIADKPARAASAAAATASRQRATVRRVVAERFKEAPRHPPRGPAAGLPPPLAGLLASLPDEGDGWTKPERDKFVTTFNAVLDFCFPITESGNDNGEPN